MEWRFLADTCHKIGSTVSRAVPLFFATLKPSALVECSQQCLLRLSVAHPWIRPGRFRWASRAGERRHRTPTRSHGSSAEENVRAETVSLAKQLSTHPLSMTAKEQRKFDPDKMLLAPGTRCFDGTFPKKARATPMLSPGRPPENLRILSQFETPQCSHDVP